MSRMNIALLGEEADATGEMTPEATDATLDTIADSPEPEIAEANEVAGDLQDADAAAAEAEEVAETLDAMAGPIEEAQADGGLTEPAAEAIRIAVEHMKSRIGMGGRRTFALEGFKSKTTRANATRIALEDIKDTAKKIWDAIVKAFNTAIEWCKKFFASLFDGAEKLKNRAEKLKKMAEEKKGKPAGKEKFQSPAYAEKLRHQNKIVPVSGLIEGFKNFGYYGPTVPVDEIMAIKLMEIASKLFDKVEDKDFKKDAMALILENGVVTKKKFENVPDGMVVLNGASLLGDRTQYLQVIKEGTSPEKAIDLIGKQKVFIDNSEDYKVITNTDMVPATPEEAGAIAESIMSFAGELIGIKNGVAKIESQQKNIQNQAKKLASNTKDDAQKNARTIAQISKSLLSLSTTTLSQLRSHQISVGNAALNYAAASLAAAGAEEKK